MEKRGKWKGTVTPLSSALPPEEARKAAKKVAEAIADKERELDHLNQFVADNADIINLVKGLPEELHHNIMVPFGKAAFFPGRLVHTNEFMVLLGEGYYAERTSKQAIDILRRRGKTLDAQVDALTGMMKDLQLEAAFFNSTADEAEEGLVEIREEFIEEDPMENTLETEDAPKKAQMDEPTRDEEKYAHIEDKEFAKMMAKLDELEREEEAEEAAAAASTAATVDADDEKLAQRVSGLGEWVSDDQINNCQEKVTEKLMTGSSGLQSSLKGEIHSKEDSLHSMRESSAEKMDTVASQSSMGIQAAPKSISKTGGSGLQSSLKGGKKDWLPSMKERSAEKMDPVASQAIFTTSKASLETSKPDAGSKISRPITDSLKAFSGSIIEHSDNLPTYPNRTTPSQPSSSQSSKPVSRFKMQRR